METNEIYVYSWAVDDKEKDVTAIRAYGINTKNENVCLSINDFTVFVYVELPSNLEWNDTKALMVCNKIDDMLGNQKPIKKSLVHKKKLYYAYLDKDKNRKLFSFLFLSFSSTNDIKSLVYKTTKPISVPGIGYIKLKIHESNASPILQLICARNIQSVGWLKFVGKKVLEDEKITHCQHEYSVKWKGLSPSDSKQIISPLVMSFDLEVYSSNPNKMPNAEKAKDEIFQISCIFARTGDAEDKYEKYLLTLFNPDASVTGEDVNINYYDSELLLLQGYVELIQEKQPNIIIGYNIFTFDIPFCLDRAKFNFISNIFDKQGFDFGHGKEKTISWSSSAYKNQEFQYLDVEGRVFVDLLPLVRRDFKMSSYTLKNISNEFLGETKDPLTPKGIFKCYELGKKNKKNAEKAMGIVGKYCVQDSVLVLKLFENLQCWFGLTEMASICNVSIFDLYSRGQQLKVFSQVYKKCMNENFVVERDAYTAKEDEHFQGAYVFDPVPGVYDRIVPFDFSSLYPSIMRAYNIDYSTFVPEDIDIPGRLSVGQVSDRDCHVIEWDEHIGCTHDTRKRKQKPKYIMCGHRRYRFLKTHKGILPMLLEDLINARKNTRKEMAGIKEKMKCIKEKMKTINTDKSKTLYDQLNDELKALQLLYTVLDKRQLALKISANSAFGGLGSTKGYLILPPAAMCVTAKGRQSIEIVSQVIPQYGGKVIYGDTDSNYVSFPHLTTSQEIWDHAEYVAKEISKLFPDPISLAFEEVIYWRFLILTMKRYMSLKCDRDGNISEKIEKKGVLLSRRDNSGVVRTIYSDIIMKIFNKVDKDIIIQTMIDYINKLCSGGFNVSDFVITKAVGSVGDMSVVPNPLKKGKGLFGDYSVPLLCPDGKKRGLQLALKNATTEEEYYKRCLPAQVQLALKMNERGQRVDAGTRLEYVILNQGGLKAKQYEKIESIEYYKEHKTSLHMDYMYYLKALAKPMDQVFACVFPEIKKFTEEQVKIRKQHMKIHAQLKSLFSPDFEFE